MKQLPAKCLYMPQLAVLKEYDDNNAGNLFQTLKVYLQHDRNLSETAAILDIHRTTLQYRISRIEALTGLRLSDYSTRFQLLISFRLMEVQQGQL